MKITSWYADRSENAADTVRAMQLRRLHHYRRDNERIPNDPGQH